MDSPPVLFDIGSELGDSYVEAMTLAGEYVSVTLTRGRALRLRAHQEGRHSEHRKVRGGRHVQ